MPEIPAPMITILAVFGSMTDYYVLKFAKQTRPLLLGSEEFANRATSQTGPLPLRRATSGMDFQNKDFSFSSLNVTVLHENKFLKTFFALFALTF